MTVHPGDEYLHQPPRPTPAKWQENFFFICWDSDGGHGLLLHLQRAPRPGWQEAQVVVVVAGKLASTSVTARFTREGLPPGLAMCPEVPFHRWRLQVEAKAASGRGPLGFLATTSDADTDTVVAVDLILETSLPVADFAEGLAAMVAGMRTSADGPQMGMQQHYEQGGIWRGRLAIDDHEVDTRGLFVRDHSWGVRDEQRFQAFWTASCLDDGRVFCNAIGIPTGEDVIGVGMVVEESGTTVTSEVGARFLPSPGLSRYAHTAVRLGDRRLEAETQLHVPIYLPRSGPRRYDNNAISTVEMDGKTGFGVMEWASVVDDDQAAQLEVRT